MIKFPPKKIKWGESYIFLFICSGVHLKINDNMKRLSRVGTVSSECPVALTALGTCYRHCTQNQTLPVNTVVQRLGSRSQLKVMAGLGPEFRHNYSSFQHVLSQLVIREEFYFLENGLNHHYHPLWVS